MPSNANSNIWFYSPQARPQARVKLFCIPYAGGGVAAYHSWPNSMPSDVEVCAIQLPGRDSRLREKPFVDLPSLVDALAEGLAPWLTSPYALFGHSMGALIAYGLVRHLRHKGGPLPFRLFVSGRRAPHVPGRQSPCHHLSDPEFVETLVQRYNGIPKAVLAEQELMNLFLPILRADFTLMETYKHIPEEPLEQAITVFGGIDDQSVNRADLDAWKDVTRGETDLHMLPGDHFFVQSARTALLNIVSRQLVLSGGIAV
jgi:medium-chain acyl-[acyl-carrier-protein] hydrolase